MPRKLLPTSAVAFTSRSPPIVVFDSTVELRWLRNTLKSIGVLKGRSDNVRQHNILTKTLSSSDAIWTLCSLQLQRAPLVEAISNYQLIHIEAYVIYVDLVQTNKVDFKLTPESIAKLTEFHKDIYLIDMAAACNDWSGERAKKLQDEFVRSVNEFGYQTGAQALLNLEPNGSGELSRGKSDRFKTAIMGLFPPASTPRRHQSHSRPSKHPLSDLFTQPAH
ncbi:hypothetical protein FGG08_006038 [Glutinoglossum americanum]|uniref:Uncharacterized protein n=1 Tax=Glutinoglossum americanum TaxID=1670608 RepID=A0A9P8HZ48_9PEZI|nr:hypothetical protein FGG08_006038 [Glutinoglossum americanum]